MKDITAAGLLMAKGPVIVGKMPGGLDLPAIVEGKGDRLNVTIHIGRGTARQTIFLTQTPAHFGGSRPGSSIRAVGGAVASFTGLRDTPAAHA